MNKLKSGLLLAGILIIFSENLAAQEEKPYNPAQDAHEQLEKAINQAGNDGKHVFVMIGGNW
jgi:hypothetical protein